MKLPQFDFAVIGAGVIGLSVARELASVTNAKVALLDRSRPGRGTSWAGAGILPPTRPEFARHPLELLAATSFGKYAELAEELFAETGIDTGFRRCGALFIARTAGEVAALAGQCSEWSATGVDVVNLDKSRMASMIPALAALANEVRSAVFVPEEAQIRNPDYTQALEASCRSRGVQAFFDAGEIRLENLPTDEVAITSEKGADLVAKRVCIAAGAWSQSLLATLGVTISTVPVRGQMLLFRLPKRPFAEIVYEGMRYIVPRDDGHVLAGSTLERAGFDVSTTDEAVENLLNFSGSVFPMLNRQAMIRAWAGLRPGTWDGMPYVGPAPLEWSRKVWVATGHFRSGLLLAPGTAVLMRQLMCDETPFLDVGPFRVTRG
jgi:glycine oxidase